MKCILFLLPSLLFSQSYKIHGLVLDDSTHLSLPYATIRVDQTDMVTSSNKEGTFLLELPAGEYSLLISYVGYNAKTVAVSVPEQSSVRIALTPAMIQMPEVSIAADAEDPAIEIMRQAIKRRTKNYEGLKNYEISGYKKDIFYKGDMIAMIDEKFVRHVYEEGKMSKEFVLSTHKTENIKNQKMNINLNIAWALFFVNGTLNVGIGNARSQPVFPLADNALQYYDFKLLQTKFAGKNATYIIQVIPRTNVEPLIRGKIFIDDATYAVIGADIETTEGWHIPLVKSFVMKIQQTYANYNGFWIPQYSELSMAGQVSALGGLVSMDRMELSEVFSASSCKVNGTVPDSVRYARRSKYGGYTTDTTKQVSALKRYRKTKRVPAAEDVTYEPAVAPLDLSAIAMNTLRPLPLTTKEVAAFAELDSSQTLDKVFKPQGALSVLSSSSDTSAGLLKRIGKVLWNYGMLHNNRVEGITPGAYIDVDDMASDFYYNAAAGYSFGLKRAEGAIGGGYNLGDDHLDRIDANGWDIARPWQPSTDISKTINSIGFTVTGKDYFNYFRSTGFNLGIHKYFSDFSFVKLYIIAERQRSVLNNSYFSLWKDHRLNPAIQEGHDNAVQLQCGYESNQESGFGSLGGFSIGLGARISLPKLGSDFDYQRVFVYGKMRINTIYSTMFNTPFLSFIVQGASVTGNSFGIQHVPTVMSALSIYAPAGVLKGVQSFDLAGEKFIALQGEHNWQTLPFLLLGLKMVESTGLQIITGASVANVWNSTPYYVQRKTWKPYWEAYVSIGNILDFVRVDFVRTSKAQNVIRLGISTLL
ncbi:MAG: DUF5686 family protein [Ignavibacteriales bacterium]|nr:DUF5686 family protein [Ignavibacteriales bacterium]